MNSVPSTSLQPLQPSLLLAHAPFMRSPAVMQHTSCRYAAHMLTRPASCAHRLLECGVAPHVRSASPRAQQPPAPCIQQPPAPCIIGWAPAVGCHLLQEVALRVARHDAAQHAARLTHPRLHARVPAWQQEPLLRQGAGCCWDRQCLAPLACPPPSSQGMGIGQSCREQQKIWPSPAGQCKQRPIRSIGHLLRCMHVRSGLKAAEFMGRTHQCVVDTPPGASRSLISATYGIIHGHKLDRSWLCIGVCVARANIHKQQPHHRPLHATTDACW